MSEPTDMPTGEPGPGGGPPRESTRPPDFAGAKIDRLLEAVRQREHQMQLLLGELSKFPAAAEKLVESVQVQVDLANSLDELLAGLADRNEELAGMIRSVSETAAEQSEILQKVHDALTRHDQTEDKTAEALQRLSAAMERQPAGGTDQLAMMEQIRQNLGRSGLALDKAGRELASVAAESRQETRASLDRLAEALQQMPRASADLAELLRRIHQTSAGLTEALTASAEQIRQKLDQVDRQAADSAKAASEVFAKDLDRLVQDYGRHAANTEKLLAPVAIASQRVARLVGRQNRLLGWLLASILVALVVLAVFIVTRPPRVVSVPFYLRGRPAVTRPATQPAP